MNNNLGINHRIEIVVTRHPAFVQYLTQLGIINSDTQIHTRATPELIKDKHVIGAIPFPMLHLCASYARVNINMPNKLKGREMTLADYYEYVDGAERYKVVRERDYAEREESISTLTDSILDSDYDWIEFKEHLENGGSPFEHIIFDASLVKGDFDDITDYVSKYATEENKEDWLFYIDGLQRGSYVDEY